MKVELRLEEIILPKMTNKTITMLKLRKLLQLKEQGYSNRRIKGIMNLSRQTVDDYVKRLKQTDKSYKELLKLDNKSLQILAFRELALTVLNDKFADLQVGYLALVRT